jgi:hypothetical protein
MTDIAITLLELGFKEHSFSAFIEVQMLFERFNNTVDPLYSERTGAAKSIHLRRVFTINVFNLTIN